MPWRYSAQIIELAGFDSRRLHLFCSTISTCCARSVQRTRVRIEWALWRGSDSHWKRRAPDEESAIFASVRRDTQGLLAPGDQQAVTQTAPMTKITCTRLISPPPATMPRRGPKRLRWPREGFADSGGRLGRVARRGVRPPAHSSRAALAARL